VAALNKISASYALSIMIQPYSTRSPRQLHSLAIALLSGLPVAWADDIRSLPAVEVFSSRYSLLGAADTANEGAVGQAQINTRIVARTGEVLEVVPGLIVSQHSGEGKANQYFLRGVNLDHGIDFRLTLAWSGLDRPEFSDSRTDLVDSLSQGALLRSRGRF
jgi:hypothetical protein